VGGRDGLELLLPALVCFAVVAVESAFGLDFGGAVLGAGGATLGHRGGAVTGVRAGLRLRRRPPRSARTVSGTAPPILVWWHGCLPSAKSR